jgi:hypothetical protein
MCTGAWIWSERENGGRGVWGREHSLLVRGDFRHFDGASEVIRWVLGLRECLGLEAG